MDTQYEQELEVAHGHVGMAVLWLTFLTETGQYREAEWEQAMVFMREAFAEWTQIYKSGLIRVLKKPWHEKDGGVW